MRKGTALLLAALLIGTLAAPAARAAETTEAAEGTEAVEMTEAADAGEDVVEQTEFEIRNPEADPETAILVVSFGTSYNESRDLTIGAIEDDIAAAYPDNQVRRAFTAQIIIDKLAQRDGLVIDNVEQALDRAVKDGVKKLVVQPTHLMTGLEFDDLAAALQEVSGQFEAIALARPLLTSDEDFAVVEQAIVDVTKEYDDGETAMVFMGHGTEAKSNEIYAKMQEVLKADGKDNYFVGTVEAEPTVEDVLALVQAGNYKKVVLRDLMVVAGDHASNDMAGDEEDSWKSIFEAAGYEVTCVLEGLGQIPSVRQQYVAHTAEAFAQLP